MIHFMNELRHSLSALRLKMVIFVPGSAMMHEVACFRGVGGGWSCDPLRFGRGLKLLG